MANHLMLVNVSLELSQDGSMCVFSENESVSLLREEVLLLLELLKNWDLGQPVQTDNVLIEVDDSGDLIILREEVKVRILENETKNLRKWLTRYLP